TRSDSDVRAVNMMIGMLAVAGRWRSSRQTSVPLRTGRFKSRITRSGVKSDIARSASSPRPTVATDASPERSSVCLMSAAISCSSSTTSTRGGVIEAQRTAAAFLGCDAGVKCLLTVDGKGPEILGLLSPFLPNSTRIANDSDLDHTVRVLADVGSVHGPHRPGIGPGYSVLGQVSSYTGGGALGRRSVANRI